MATALALARHILVKTQNEAEQLKQRLAKGDDFAKLAKKHSGCKSARGGGDLGEVKPGQMIKIIDQVIFKKPILTVYGPIKTQFGYHLVHVVYRD